MGFSKGQKVTLKNVALYVASDSKKKAATKSGTYYIWSAATRNGRIRITSKKAYCGKTPAGKYVTGWINTSTISSSSSSNMSDAIKKAVQAVLKNVSKSGSGSSSNSGSSGSGSNSNSLIPTTVRGEVGYLGKVQFIVREDAIMTISNFVMNRSISCGEHARHGRSALVEFTGINAEEVTFDIFISRYLGFGPLTETAKLKNYMYAGTALPLKIGEYRFGRDRWIITNLSFRGDNSTKRHNWGTALVSVTLKGYE